MDGNGIPCTNVEQRHLPQRSYKVKLERPKRGTKELPLVPPLVHHQNSEDFSPSVP